VLHHHVSEIMEGGAIKFFTGVVVGIASIMCWVNLRASKGRVFVSPFTLSYSRFANWSFEA